jgi:antitoxin YefM
VGARTPDEGSGKLHSEGTGRYRYGHDSGRVLPQVQGERAASPREAGPPGFPTLDDLKEVNRAINDDPGQPERYTLDQPSPHQSRLSARLSDVSDRREHLLVTRNGKPIAALVPIDEYEALKETVEVLSDTSTLAAIEAGVAQLARDDAVTLKALRAELAQRRAGP